jgi:glutamine synthetase
MESCRETFEYRGPDPLANPHLLFAGITVAINYGFENPKEALKIAEDLHVEEVGKRKRLKILPRSCNESAKNLRKERKLYEADNVFPKILIDKTINKLKNYKDKDLWKTLTDKPEKIENILKQYLHNG